MKKSKLCELNQKELKLINGGGWQGLVIGAAALIIAGAAAVGYYDGKADCPPPPCED